MIAENLESRVATLEKQMDELTQLLAPSKRKKDWRRTVGMFADDPEFDAILRLGREWRERQNRMADE